MKIGFILLMLLKLFPLFQKNVAKSVDFQTYLPKGTALEASIPIEVLAKGEKRRREMI